MFITAGPTMCNHNSTYWALACISAWRLARADDKHAANTVTKDFFTHSLSVDKILLMRIVMGLNRSESTLGRELQWVGERAQMDGGATDNQTQLNS